jgi:hypothetical protein
MNLIIAIVILHFSWPSVLWAWAPAADPQAPPPESARAELRPEDVLLDRLEAAAADLRSFTADLRYHKWDPVLQREEIRVGTIIFQAAAEPPQSRRFAVSFEALYRGSRKVEQKRQYIFESPWLVEIDHEAKEFYKRQVVPPGEQRDPLKLGEGPFPLPIGQARQEVLDRFEVNSIKVPTNGLLNSLSNVQGLRLTPRPGTSEAEDYLHVDIFYDDATLLPVGVEAIERQQLEPGDDPLGRGRKTVLLANLARNPELSAEQVDALAIREPDGRDWKIVITPWEQPAGE